jgi:LL-diaminopimelate aminotransferase
MKTANRLRKVEEYYFSHKLREIAKLRATGKNVLNLAIGSPDLSPHPDVISELQQTAEDQGAHRYQPYQGIPELRQAIADFYQRKYQVSLDSSDEVLPLMGSKEGITHISLAYLNPGDKVLVPELAYPTYQAVTEMVEAEVIRYPLNEEKNWEPDWSFFETLDPGIRMIWINYPHMPTGAKGSLDWMEKFVQIARHHDVLLVHDNPYSFILNDHPLSIFNVEGSREVALELNSMSKTFNMAGWRVGWVCGNKELIEPVLRIKSNMDSGMYLPVQKATIQALSLDQTWYDQLNGAYGSRRKRVFDFLDRIDCSYDKTQQGMFVWAKVNAQSGATLVDELLYEHDIFITPGKIFGAAGENYVRVSLCSTEDVFRQAINRLNK